MNSQIQARLARLATSPFRAKFHLNDKDLALLRAKGIKIIRQHAYDLIAQRLAPANPSKDGKQTPYRGHPVFVAQHATATCCRKCLERWHHIAKGRGLSETEQEYLVDVIQAWLEREAHLKH